MILAAASYGLDLSIPAGLPPAQQLADIPKGFTLNAEVLERYGYTLDQYNALEASERERVTDWIEVLEHDRLVAEYKKSAAKNEPVKLKLSKETEAAMARLKANLGSNFDGDAKTGGGASSWVPSLTMRGQPASEGDSMDYSGTLRRLSLTNPGHDLTLSYGLLGADGISPLVEASPYAGVEKGWRGSNGTIDYDGRASAYALNLGARVYPNDDGPVDAQINQGLATLPTLGIKPGDAQSLSNSLSYSSSFQQQWMFLGSMMGRVGRAYHLLGDEVRGVDWGWSAMGNLRVDQIFPNASLDQTVGVRIRPDPSHNIGIFGGVTEGLGLFSRSMVADSLSSGQLQTDIHPEAAPHATIASWGKMPYLSGVQYEVSAGRQWNPWTTVNSAAAAVTADAGNGVKIGAFGSYSDESGADIEYERRKSAAGVKVSPSQGVDISAQYFNQSATYGDAQVQGQGVMLGLTLREQTPGGGRGGSVTMDSLFGGELHLVPNQASSQMVQMIQSLLNLADTLKDSGLGAAGGAGPAWQDVQAGWAKLDPAAQQALSDAYRAAVPSGPSLAQIIATKPADIASLNKLINLVSDTQLMERVLVRYMRHEILQAIANTQVPVLGKSFQLNAPMIIAAANAYGLSLSPIPPITSANARQSLDAFLLNQGASALGCPKGAQPQAATDCLLAQLPKAEADKLRQQYGDDINAILKAAVQWPSDVIRREMNQAVLQVILAADTLNELTVEKGARLSELNEHGLMASFQYLDERSRRENARVFSAAKQDLKEELAAQDAAMREQLAEYGASRLAWLQGQAAWPSGVRVAVRPGDWAPLLAVYGDKQIFDLILRCKAALAAKGGNQGLLITLDRVSPLNSVTISRGNPAELRLPPKPVGLSTLELSF